MTTILTEANKYQKLYDQILCNIESLLNKNHREFCEFLAETVISTLPDGRFMYKGQEIDRKTVNEMWDKYRKENGNK